MTEQLSQLVDRAAQARRERLGAEAKELWFGVIRLAREERERRVEIRGHMGVAQAERDAGNNFAAIAPYEEAVRLGREEGDALLLAHSVRHLGDVLRHENRLDEAKQCYDEAIAIYRRESGRSPLDFANALRPMAILREQMGGDARDLWREARDMYRAAGVETGAIEAEKRMERLGGAEER